MPNSMSSSLSTSPTHSQQENLPPLPLTSRPGSSSLQPSRRRSAGSSEPPLDNSDPEIDRPHHQQHIQNSSSIHANPGRISHHSRRSTNDDEFVEGANFMIVNNIVDEEEEDVDVHVRAEMDDEEDDLEVNVHPLDFTSSLITDTCDNDGFDEINANKEKRVIPPADDCDDKLGTATTNVVNKPRFKVIIKSWNGVCVWKWKTGRHRYAQTKKSTTNDLTEGGSIHQGVGHSNESSRTTATSTARDVTANPESTEDDEDDTCGICRVPFDACCPDCLRPGDDCPLAFGECSHAFHIHCIMKWVSTSANASSNDLNASSNRNGEQLCPMCRQEWKFEK